MRAVSYLISFFCPDTHVVYDLHTLDKQGIGGGITARIRIAHALAESGHSVTIYNHCPRKQVISGVQYIPFDQAKEIDTDIFIAGTSGGDLDLTPVTQIDLRAKLKLLMVHGIDPPSGVDLAVFDYIYSLSNFITDRISKVWKVPGEKIFTSYRGVREDFYPPGRVAGDKRDRYGLVFLSHPSKGLSTALELVDLLQKESPLFNLHIYGGYGLWGDPDKGIENRPNVHYHGLMGQKELARELGKYAFAVFLHDLEETFGISLVESMRAGCIPIASQVGAYPELIEDGVNGFLIDDSSLGSSPAAAANIILDLIEDQPRAAQIRSSARAAPLSWREIAFSWTGHWDHVLNQGKEVISQDGTRCPVCLVSVLPLADGNHCPECGRFIKKKLASMIEQKQRILISGYYGFGNTGDEAVLQAMISDLQSACPETDLCVISGNPAETHQSHQVKSVPIHDLQAVISEVKRSDVVIIGGGGLFHDYWDVDLSGILSDRHHGLTLYCSIALLTSQLNKPLMIYGAGVGPLQTSKGKQCTRAVFESARAITVRDQASKRALSDLGLDPEKIAVTADPSFRWPGIHKKTSVPVQIDAPKPYLGIALRNWDLGPASDSWEGRAAEAIDDYLDLQEGSAVFIPFQKGEDRASNDLEIANRIYGQLRNRQRAVVLNGDLSSAEIFSVISRCDVLLGMRLHAIIFAALNGVPIVGLAYDPKINIMMGQLDLADYALPLDEIQPRLVVTSLEKAVENAANSRKQFQLRTKELSQKALANTEAAVRLLDQLQNASADPAAARDWLSETIFPLLIDSIQEKEKHLVDLEAQRKSTLHAQTLENKEVRETNTNLRRLIDEERTAHREALKEHQNQLSQLLSDLNHERSVHQEQTRAFESRISHLTSELGHQKTLVEEKNARIKQAGNQLSEIKGSRGWKMLWFLWEVRDFLIPNGSRFEKVISNFWQGVIKGVYRIVHPFRSAKNRRRGWGMSKFEFAFDQYKRARSRKFSRDLSSLRLPGRPGLVSIVLPVYNGEKYIAEAVESILAQTYQDFELIIINDGSEDNTARIIDRFQRKDRRIRVIDQENRKLPLALSRGFDLAQGEYLTWTSHDNRLLPDFLERMVLSLREHPDWDMVYANQDIIDGAGAPLRGSAHYRGYQWPPGSEHIKLPMHTGELNTKANNFIGGAFLYRQRVHWLLGDYSPLRFTREDYDYWMRVNALLTLKHTAFQDSVYEYRFHQNSLTHRDQEIGITRDRKKLMAFDDFRRDFYLSPAIWVLENDPLLEEPSRELTSLISSVKKAGHLILDRKTLDSYNLPKLWMPRVYLYISHSLELIPDPPQDLPINTMKVFMNISPDQALPQEISDPWDICVAFGSDAAPSQLDQIRKGWLVSDEMQAILAAIDIRLRSYHLEKIEEDISSDRDDELKISVIVCTYHRPQQLADTLRSIALQTMDKAEFEVIIVDNQPVSEEAAGVVQTVREDYFQEHPSHIRVVDCPLPGLSQARNAGLSEAKGELLYFIDDDAAAEPNVLEVYGKLFSENPTAGVIGGQIIFQHDDPLPIVWRKGWEKYWSHLSVDVDNYQTVENWWEFPWGANWCARKIALKQIGGFRTGYGRTGEDFSGGEEIVAASLIKRLGYSVGITPRAAVKHNIEGSRLSLNHLRRTIHAGLMTEYQAETELRLHPESSRAKLGGFPRVPHFLRSLLRARKDQRRAVIIETSFFILARWRIFLRKIVGSIKHFRRPVTAR